MPYPTGQRAAAAHLRLEIVAGDSADGRTGLTASLPGDRSAR